MKIAVIYSGAIRIPQSFTDVAIKSMQDVLADIPAEIDYHFFTWTTEPRENFPSLHDVTCFDPPKFNYYTNLITGALGFAKSLRPDDPRYNSERERVGELFKNRAKYRLNLNQHIGHLMACEYIGEKLYDYDIIIRPRYDFYHSTDSKATIHDRIRNTLRTGRVNGLGSPKAGSYIGTDGIPSIGILDQLIIHRPESIDIQYAAELYENKQISFGESGWYDILVSHMKRKQYFTGIHTTMFRLYDGIIDPSDGCEVQAQDLAANWEKQVKEGWYVKMRDENPTDNLTLPKTTRESGENLNLRDMVGGWFIGDFEPSVLRTKDFEVGIKWHAAGEKWDVHYHKEAVEYNVLIKGTMYIKDQTYTDGDIFILEKNEVARPQFHTDCLIVTVKTPSVIGDKYIIEE